MLRLGRISYANMAPVFYRVEMEVEEVLGVPTDLNRMLIDGELDTRRSRRSSTRATRTS
jgi:Predicted periplasmic solute-binding protein